MENQKVLEILKSSKGKEVEIKLNTGETFSGGLLSSDINEERRELKVRLSGKVLNPICTDRIVEVNLV
jgi:hypothetical protein